MFPLIYKIIESPPLNNFTYSVGLEKPNRKEVKNNILDV